MRQTALTLLILTGVLASFTASAGPPATRPATSAPASRPAEPVVRWHETYEPAAAEAARRKCLLVVVYFDLSLPACEYFEEMTLSKPATRSFLAAFAACRLNVADAAKKKRFKATGFSEPPLTQVLSPDGELLNELAGCILPASRFRGQLQATTGYYAASTVKPFDAAARWRAVQARLQLSTSLKAVADIDGLLKLPAGKRPRGVGRPELLLARGQARRIAKPEKAREDFAEVMKLAPKDPATGGRALLALADMAWGREKIKSAHERYARYLRDYPKGPEAGTAAIRKAMVEFSGLKDAAAARATLGTFIRGHPDDAKIVDAKALLESLEKLKDFHTPKRKPARKPTTRPARPAAPKGAI